MGADDNDLGPTPTCGRNGAFWRIETISISPDDALAITAGEDGTARIWSVESGRELEALRGHGKEVNAAAFFPDGKMALTASRDATIRLWDATTYWTEIRRLDNGAELESAIIAPSGEWFAGLGVDSIINIWRQNGELISSIKVGFDATTFAASKDSRFIAVGGYEGQLQTYEASTGQLIGQFVGHKCEISGLAFSRDGHLLLSSSSPRHEINEKDFSLRLWDVTTHTEIHRFEDYKERVLKMVALEDAVVGITEAFSHRVGPEFRCGPS